MAESFVIYKAEITWNMGGSGLYAYFSTEEKAVDWISEQRKKSGSFDFVGVCFEIDVDKPGRGFVKKEEGKNG